MQLKPLKLKSINILLLSLFRGGFFIGIVLIALKNHYLHSVILLKTQSNTWA